MTDEVARRFAGIFVDRLPALDPMLALRYSTITLSIVKAFLGLATSPVLPREALVAELKTVLLRYLEPLVGQPHPPTAAAPPDARTATA